MKTPLEIHCETCSDCRSAVVENKETQSGICQIGLDLIMEQLEKQSDSND